MKLHMNLLHITNKTSPTAKFSQCLSDDTDVVIYVHQSITNWEFCTQRSTLVYLHLKKNIYGISLVECGLIVD